MLRAHLTTLCLVTLKINSQQFLVLATLKKQPKAEDANTADGTASNIVFGIGSYTYVHTKVEFTNSDASAVNYTIDFKDSSSPATIILTAK